MKKITTSGRSFGTAQSLTRQQLKNVMGGVDTTNPLVCNTNDCEYLANPTDHTLTKAKCGKRSVGMSVSCACGPVTTSDCDYKIIVP